MSSHRSTPPVTAHRANGRQPGIITITCLECTNLIDITTKSHVQCDECLTHYRVENFTLINLSKPFVPSFHHWNFNRDESQVREYEIISNDVIIDEEPDYKLTCDLCKISKIDRINAQIGSLLEVKIKVISNLITLPDGSSYIDERKVKIPTYKEIHVGSCCLQEFTNLCSTPDGAFTDLMKCKVKFNPYIKIESTKFSGKEIDKEHVNPVHSITEIEPIIGWDIRTEIGYKK